MNKCIFLDRDGIINEERGNYTWLVTDFIIKPDVKNSLELLKKNGYLLIIITNQGGINKGIYSKNDVFKCHYLLQSQIGNLIDDIYYSPYHDDFTKSLSRKPDSLLFERAIKHHKIAPNKSFMIGDSERDMVAAEKAGIKGLIVKGGINNKAKPSFESLAECTKYILSY